MLYTDPGSSLLIWQVLAAAAFGTLFYVRKIFSFFRRENGPRDSSDPALPEAKDKTR